MSSEDSGRKRSRWGNGMDGDRTDAGAVMPAAVPDEVALHALLNEAHSRKVERDNKQSHNHVKKIRADSGARQERQRKQDGSAEGSYYGPASSTERTSIGTREDDTTEAVVEKEKPNFGVSGALAKDLKAGNVYRGVLLKFQEPPEARAPNTLWRLYVYKADDLVETLHINRQSAYLCGRNTDIADIPLLHPSCSSQHAVIQFRAIPDPATGKLNTKPYLMDLESANGTLLNGVPIDPARYYQLKKGDVLRFGASTREYVLLTATAKSL